MNNCIWTNFFDSLVKRDHGHFDFTKVTLSPFKEIIEGRIISSRNNDADVDDAKI